jgi:proteasome-associated ATPase
VVVFFDEMDSLFRTRGSGVSSDVETTIVPQLLAEIDGVEGLENVIVIGATNREDMIDPAILRPGRLDVKIKIERPDAEAARDIFRKYLTPDLPLDAGRLAEHGGDRRRRWRG